jgi:CDP-diacylglycerol---serine O-phosphatidyltransferase
MFLRLDESSRSRWRVKRRADASPGQGSFEKGPPADGPPPQGPSTSITIAQIIPNAVTTLALCSGLASIHFSLNEQWHKAILAIVASAIFDVLDGGAARLLRTSSRFGAVLDSLSDFVSFGVAPAIILHQWLLRETTTKLVDSFGLMAVMCFAVCAGLRLARFTANALSADAEPQPRKTRSGITLFVGMPTPAAAGCVLIPAMLAASERLRVVLPTWPEWVIATYTIVIGLLMVSRVPTFSLKGLRIPRRLLAPALVLLVLLFAQFISEPWLTVAGLAAVYLLSVVWSMVLGTFGFRAKRSA